MKKSLLAFAILCTLAGCSAPAPSLHSLIPAEQTIATPDLSGAWVEEEDQPENASPLVWIFEKQKDHQYNLTVQIPDDEASYVLSVRVARLGGYSFIDGVLKQATGRGKDIDTAGLWIPVHYFGRIDVAQDEIHIRLLSADWLEKASADGHTNLGYERLDDDKLLVAPTADLQNFAIQYGSDEEAFSFTYNLSRQKQPSH